ncbi:MAG: TaqI-like C-terminal specificity domain-containing protein [Flammeovirgaceae bacterium]
MFSHHTIFPPKDFKKTELDAVMQGVTDLEDKKKIIHSWQKMIQNGSIYTYKEIELQANFLFDFFGKILGYLYEPHLEERFLSREVITENDMTRPDGVLGYFKLNEEKVFEKDIRVVIELKDANTHLDNKQRRIKADTPVNQAFSYAHKFGGKVRWVIVSNFVELRLYHTYNSSRYESFEIERLLEPQQLARFFFLLQKDRLFLEKTESPIDLLLENRRAEELRIEFRFYEEYSGYRELLFFNLIRSNFQEEQHELLAASQKILDRILFIAFVRDTIPMANVLGKVRKTKEELAVTGEQWLWMLVKGLFKSFDKGLGSQVPSFNGGLFAFDPFLDEKLVVLDDYIVPIIDFILKYDYQSELNVNLLGHIFEQSISDLERLKEKIDRKEFSSIEVVEKLGNEGLRKKDGIFYTPNYITQYIVSQTIGEYLEEQKSLLYEKHQEENLAYWTEYEDILLKLKILDPACGSGAFLVAVFEYLWGEWKILLSKKSIPTKKTIADGLFKSNGNGASSQEWKIKKLIVENNLFGVDLNMESVAISKLSLWILTANTTVTLAHLSENIKQGNSLVEDKNISERAFDWQKEFSKIFENQGFDIIVGNPPYVRQEILGEKVKKYFEKRYPSVYSGVADLYVYFYAKSFELLKNNGFLCFITPNKWFKTAYGEKLRDILKAKRIIKIVDFFEIKVFEDADTEPQIILLQNKESNQDFDYYKVTKSLLGEGGVKDFADKLKNKIAINKSYLQTSEWVLTDTKNYEILEAIMGKKTLKTISLDEYTQKNIYRGITTGLNSAFIIDKKTKEDLIKKDFNNHKIIKPYVNPTDIKKWHIENVQNNFFINTGYDLEISDKSFPLIFKYLKPFEKQLEARFDKGKTPFNLRACDYYDEFDKPKIIYIHTALEHYFYYDIEGYYLNNSAYFISNADLFLSAFLNSSIFRFYKKHKFVAYGNPEEGGRSKLDYNKMVSVPIPILTPMQKKPFEERVLKLQELSKSLYNISSQFILLFQGEFRNEKLSKKLDDWYEYNWLTFVEELKKFKKNIPLKDKKDWIEVFEQKRISIINLKNEIAFLENEIDEMLFQLYNFSREECEFIKNAK